MEVRLELALARCASVASAHAWRNYLRSLALRDCDGSGIQSFPGRGMRATSGDE